MEVQKETTVPDAQVTSSEGPSKRNIAKRIWSVFTTVVVVIVVLLAALLVGARLVGLTPYTVLSPSMTPNYLVGDLIYAQKKEFSEIQVGDAIVFVAGEDLTIVTHRVVEIDAEGQRFFTQGDANKIRDTAPVLYENVQGVVVFSLPKLGYVSSYLTSPSGRYVGIAVVLGLLLLLILPELFKPDSGKKTKSR